MGKMDRVDMIVHGCWVVPAHDRPAISDGAVVIVDGCVLDVGPYDEIVAKYPKVDRILGDQRFMVIPGLINGHSHGRGLSDFQRGGIDNTLESWRLNSATYIPIPVYEDVAYSAIRMLRSGVTACMHNHLLRDATDASEQFTAVIKAYRDVGLRLLFCPGVKDTNSYIYGDHKNFTKNLPPETVKVLSAKKTAGMSPDQYFQVARDLHTEYQTPFTRIGFGPVAPQWCTTDLLQAVKQEADALGAPIHLHTLQTVFQKIYALKTHGKSYIAYLKEIGLLDNNLVLGHCVFSTDEDIALMAASGTGVTHHGSCNLRQRNGIAPVYSMLAAGVTVGMGLDGKSINDDDDFIQEMKVCRLLHRLSSMELDSDCLSNRQVLMMATENSARLIGFGEELGRLEPGRFADLVLLDYQAMTYPFTDPNHDPVDVLLYRGVGRHVDTVMVHGKVVLEKGRVLGVDETRIAARLAEAASRPLSKDELTYKQAIDVLRTNVVKFFRSWPEKVELKPFYLLNSRVNELAQLAEKDDKRERIRK
jgi:cytosine/adenosine deaminase-related metal-dependent hydrolase